MNFRQRASVVSVGIVAVSTILWIQHRAHEREEKRQEAAEKSESASLSSGSVVSKGPNEKDQKPQASPEKIKTLNQLNQSSKAKKKFQSQVDENGNVTGLMGESDPRPKSAQAARNFLEEISDLLGIDSFDQVSPTAQADDLAVGKKYFFQQVFDDGSGRPAVEVYGGGLAVFQNDQGSIWLVNSNYIRGVGGISTQVTFPFEEARELAVKDAGQPISGVETHKNSKGDPTPVIVLDESRRARLTWLIYIAQHAQEAVWIYFYDAQAHPGQGRQVLPRKNSVVH